MTKASEPVTDEIDLQVRATVVKQLGETKLDRGYALDAVEIKSLIIQQLNLQNSDAHKAMLRLFNSSIAHKRLDCFCNTSGQMFLRRPLTAAQRKKLDRHIVDQVLQLVSNNSIKHTPESINSYLSRYKNSELKSAIQSLQYSGLIVQLADGCLLATTNNSGQRLVRITQKQPSQYPPSSLNENATSKVNVLLNPQSLDTLKQFAETRGMPLEVAGSYLMSKIIAYVDVCNEMFHAERFPNTTPEIETPVYS